VQKALKLVSDGHCSVNFAANICNISRSSLIRAREAIKKGREPQVWGRPKIFSDSEKENVIQIVSKEQKEGIKVDYAEGKRVVNLFASICTNENFISHGF
jgi:hypothetical protein